MSESTTHTNRRRRVWLGGLIALVVLAVLGAVSLGATSSSQSGATAGADPGTQARLAAARRIPGDPLALGPVDAPVVISEWGDFQCPFCRAYTLNTEPSLVRQYVDSGRVRLEWHDFAYLGPESVLAARAARAAGRQGKFWLYHDALYRQQGRENSGAITDASLAATARGLGLDLARFQHDYADPAIAAQVSADQERGAALGVTGVPSFLIGGEPVVGAEPLATFHQVIDAVRDRGR
ncbi:MAG: thioredoxin domain-containing protein [Pseudonocardiaceae bacterium]